MPTHDNLDHVKIRICSGSGGAGFVHFRRERFLPKGGPDGGNGGRGGHIILQGSQHLSNLIHFKYRKHIFAQHGKPGAAKNTTGADGKDTIIQVPLGTIAKDADTGQLKADITQSGQQQMLAKGGKGGKGNTHFKSATKQAPDFAQPGQPGENINLVLELKTLADVGLLGAPNAGKSTLLSVISAAKPCIAPYPFTTINPQLGTLAYAAGPSFLVADIPGIIQGASQNKGLGLRFLRHVERTKILLFLIAADDKNAPQTYYMLRKELQTYNPALICKKHIVAITKIDLCDHDQILQIAQALPKDITYIAISSVQKIGIPALKKKLKETLLK